MISAKLTLFIASLTIAVPCFAGNTGGGGVLGITVLRNQGFLGPLKQQRVDLPVEYLGQIGETDILKTNAKNFIDIKRSIKAAGVTIKAEDKVIRSFILNTENDDQSIHMKTLEGNDIRIVTEDVEVDPVDQSPDIQEEAVTP